MSDLKEPKHFLVLRILGFSFLTLGIVLIILGCAVFRMEFGSNDTTINPALFAPGMFLCIGSITCFLLGYSAKIEKMAIQSKKYIQDSNKENLKDIANLSADISSEAITKVGKSIKEGIKDKVFCKHCGAEIDSDSKFCKKCGKEQ